MGIVSIFVSDILYGLFYSSVGIFCMDFQMRLDMESYDPMKHGEMLFWCDGVPYSDVIEFDDVEGYLIYNVKDSSGNFLIEDDCIVTFKVYGNVRVEFNVGEEG